MDLEKLIKDKKIRIDKKQKDDSVLKNSQFAFREITKGFKKSSKRLIRESNGPLTSLRVRLHILVCHLILYCTMDGSDN